MTRRVVSVFCPSIGDVWVLDGDGSGVAWPGGLSVALTPVVGWKFCGALAQALIKRSKENKARFCMHP
jgi:hypothetical protein